jgi:hypothetical protein
MVEGHKPHGPDKKKSRVVGCIVGGGIILHGLSALALSTKSDIEIEKDDRTISYTQQGAIEVTSGAIVLLTTFSRRK